MDATEITLDEQLATRLQRLLGPRHPVAAVALVTSGRSSPATPSDRALSEALSDGTLPYRTPPYRTVATVASQGADLESDFELASISKGITGLLYADALRREEVRPETTLGELLPLEGTAAGRVRLDALGTHRSGLPRLPAAAQPWRRTFALWRHGSNPYGETLDQLLDQARGVRVGRSAPRYSNLGFELLGHALASAAGTSYAELVGARVADPLGMDGCYVPATDEQLRLSALLGRSRAGRPRQPWTGEALGPAGGVRATIRDLARLASSLSDGSAPGISALDPVEPFGAGARIGTAWITIDVKGRAITWHNGGSGGFRSWLGLDREAGTAVAILSATSASVDRQGFALLAEHTAATTG